MPQFKYYAKKQGILEGQNQAGAQPRIFSMASVPCRYGDFFFDELTGLYNFSSIQREITRLDCSNLPVSVILCDLNGLKNTNYALGYSKGDRILAESAKILRMNCASEGIIARYGGDEFIVLLPHTGVEKTQNLCEMILHSYNMFVSLHENADCCPSMTLGYATKTASSESLESAIKSAEELMNLRKLLENKSMRSSLLTALKRIMYHKSRETAEHAQRLVTLSRGLGQALNLTDKQLVELELLAVLHDIGKINIDNRVLLKPGALSESEWSDMKKHPEIGYQIVRTSPELLMIAKYIFCHHERWDGKGYPNGIGGNSIPLLSRIISVVDAFDAMTVDRPYRDALPKEVALAEILKNAGTQFDPIIARTFVKMHAGYQLVYSPQKVTTLSCE